MKLNHPLLRNMLSLLGAGAVRLLSRTIDCKAVYFDPTVDPVHPRFAGCFVYAGWHEYMLMHIALRGDRRMLALASEHADAEILSRVMRRLGWEVARGSSTRGPT